MTQNTSQSVGQNADQNADQTLRTVVVATGNAHKVVEIETILSRVLPNTRFVALKELGDFPDPVEDGATFEENAFIKADAAHKQTGLPAVADDSGLVVDALDGAPGIYSARWCGHHGDDAANNAKLLRELEGVADDKRTARFASCVVFVDDNARLSGMGYCEGTIAHEPRGENGFGYDPLFLPADAPGRTMAQLDPDEKNAISHRFHALQALAQQLES